MLRCLIISLGRVLALASTRPRTRTSICAMAGSGLLPRNGFGHPGLRLNARFLLGSQYNTGSGRRIGEHTTVSRIKLRRASSAYRRRIKWSTCSCNAHMPGRCGLGVYKGWNYMCRSRGRNPLWRIGGGLQGHGLEAKRERASIPSLSSHAGSSGNIGMLMCLTMSGYNVRLHS